QRAVHPDFCFWRLVFLRFVVSLKLGVWCLVFGVLIGGGSRTKKRPDHSSARFDPKSGAERVLVKHLHRVERVFGEIFPNERQLAQYVVSNRDDMTADGFGVEDIQQFT